MAEQQGKAHRNGTNGRGLSARQAVEAVRSDFPSLLGRPLEAVLGVERSDDSGWLVTVQVVELERIPPSTDVLASYEVQLDDDGCILRFERVRRYHRSEAQRGGRA